MTSPWTALAIPLWSILLRPKNKGRLSGSFFSPKKELSRYSAIKSAALLCQARIHPWHHRFWSTHMHSSTFAIRHIDAGWVIDATKADGRVEQLVGVFLKKKHAIVWMAEHTAEWFKLHP